MTPAFDNGVAQLWQGDARQVLRELPAESVHCVVTSPPYMGLRDYGLSALVWGGVEGHAHEWGEPVRTPWANEVPGPNGISKNTPAGHWKPKETGPFCPCGAWLGSLGLEPSIDLYVQHIVELFREVRRVLRKDGTLWLNMGDNFSGSGKGQMGDASHSPEHGTKQGTSAGTLTGGLPTGCSGLKPKDLCMMPARVALALQADGWWLRSKIIWAKSWDGETSEGQTMPGSQQDRPTSAYEEVFLLSKAAHYFWDDEAAKAWAGGAHMMRDVWRINPTPMGTERCKRDGLIYDARQYKNLPRLDAPYCDLQTREEGVHTYVICRGGAHWDWSSHFACFPEALVEPCVLAGTSQRGVCPDCGAPWRRVVEASGGTIGRSWHDHKDDLARGHRDDGHEAARGYERDYKRSTTGWSSACACAREETVPATVLDPCAGSGTVGYVAQRLGRHSIGIELSPDYLALAAKRLRGQTLPMMV